MKRKIFLALFIPTLALAACGPAAEAPAPMSTMSADFFGVGGAPAMQESYAAPAAPEAMPREASNQPVSADRLVIRNASLSIVVADVPGRVTAIQNMAAAMGGFVVESSTTYQRYTLEGEPVPQAYVVIRVPQEKFNEAIEQIKANTVEVQNESQSGQDVTDQYVDLQSRLKAKLATEEQLLEIMQEARRTEDVLAVYAQLQQVQSDIEVLRGQIKYTEQSAALSSISVSITAEETIEPIEVGPWKPAGAARDAIQHLVYFMQSFVDGLITFVLYTLPVLISYAIPLFLVFLLGRWIWRKLRRPKADEAAITPPKKK